MTFKNEELQSDQIRKLIEKRVEFLKSQQNNQQNLSIKVKNRRKKMLDKLIIQDEYFNEESIKLREPFLYFLYIDRYKRNGQYSCKNEINNISLSNIIFSQIDQFTYEKGLQDQLNQNLSLKVSYYIIKQLQIYNKKELSEILSKDKKIKEISQEEQEDNEDELIQLMHWRFLNGFDNQFINYNEIDNNEELDDLELENQIDQDKYFEETEFSNENNTDTGVLDY